MTATASSHTTGNAPTADRLVVTSLSAPDSAAPNSSVGVSATVTNPGTAETTELVEFRVAGSVADRQWVTLGPGEQTTVDLSADTTGVPPGEYIHGVFTETDGAFDTLTVSESFTVDSLDVPANATSGANITAQAQVSNPNDMNATQDIKFRFAGGVLVDQSLTLAANETTNVSLDVDLTGVAEGTYVHGLYTRDSGQQATLSVTPNNTTAEPATVNFTNQSSDGGSVVVDSVTLPEGGFVAIHDSSLLDGNVIGSVIGVSQPLSAGTYENLTVELFTVPGGPAGELTEDETLIAMPHLDTNGNDVYEFVLSGGMDDGPYLSNGSAVTASGTVSVGPADDNGTAPPMDNGTAPPEDNETTPGNETTPDDETTPTDEEPASDETPTEGTPTAEDAGTATPASFSALLAMLPGFF